VQSSGAYQRLFPDWKPENGTALLREKTNPGVALERSPPSDQQVQVMLQNAEAVAAVRQISGQRGGILGMVLGPALLMPPVLWLQARGWVLANYDWGRTAGWCLILGMVVGGLGGAILWANWKRRRAITTFFASSIRTNRLDVDRLVRMSVSQDATRHLAPCLCAAAKQLGLRVPSLSERAFVEPLPAEPFAVASSSVPVDRQVQFEWVSSLIFVSFTHHKVLRLRPGQNAALAGAPYTFLTLLFGWWSITGFVSSVRALANNLSGGLELSSKQSTQRPRPIQAELQRKETRIQLMTLGVLLAILGAILVVVWLSVH
jgi:hypothetical protein